MECIKAWFQAGRPYEQGVQLYLQYGTDITLKMVLQREEKTAFKDQRLRDAMRKLLKPSTPSLSRHDISEAGLPPAHTILPSSPYHRWPTPPIEDAVIKALWLQFKPKYGEMRSLQQRLYTAALGGLTDPNKKQEAHDMASRIVLLDDEIDAIYAQRDAYMDGGQLPGVATQKEEVYDPVRWATELKNNERYVRDYKLKLSKFPNDTKVPKWTATLQQKEKLVAKYRKLLKLDE